jgi:hypothetical protein
VLIHNLCRDPTHALYATAPRTYTHDDSEHIYGQVPLLTNNLNLKLCSPLLATDPFGEEVLLFPWVLLWITDWPEGSMGSLIQGGWKCPHFCRFCFCPRERSFEPGFFAAVCTGCELFPKLAITDNASPQARTVQNTRELIDDVFIARASNDEAATLAAEQVRDPFKRA